MKILSMILFFLLTSTAHSADVPFTWDANPAEDNITGYRLYQNSGTNKVLDIAGDVTAITLPNVAVGVHAFSLTAYRVEVDGDITESDHSDYATVTIKGKPIKRPTLRSPIIIK